MVQSRCVLLPSSHNGEEGAPLLLPAGTEPEDALSQGRLFETSVAGGGRLLWSNDGAVGWQHNTVASGLTHMQVCGDAVLVLPPSPAAEVELFRRMDALAGRRAAGSKAKQASSGGHAALAQSAGSMQPTVAKEAAPQPTAASSAASPPASSGRRRQEQQDLLLSLLRCFDAGAAPARPAGSGGAAAAAPGRPVLAAAGAAVGQASGPHRPPAAPGTPRRGLTGARGSAACPPDGRQQIVDLQKGRQAEQRQAEQRQAEQRQAEQRRAEQRQAEQRRAQADRAATAQRQRGLQRQPKQERQEQGAAQHDAQMYECEPRQALLWSIAARATSMSWQPGQQAGGASGSGASGGAGSSCGAGSGSSSGRDAGVPTPPDVACKPTSKPHTAAGDQPAAAALPPALPIPHAADPGGQASAPLQQPQQPACSGGVAGLVSEPVPELLPNPPALAPSKHRCSLDYSRWGDLQPEMLAMVLARAGHEVATARTLSQVCAGWRRGLAGERGALQQLRIAGLRRLPGSGSGERCGGEEDSSRGRGGESYGGCKGTAQLPQLVHLAVKAGNVAATVAAARFLDRQLAASYQDESGGSSSGGSWGAPDSSSAAGWYSSTFAMDGSGDSSEGPSGGRYGFGYRRRGSRHGGGGGVAGLEADVARLWGKAAKLGHPEGQWKMGYAYYKGLLGLPFDSEEAVLWLTRATRQLSTITEPGTEAGGRGSRSGDSSGGSADVAAAAPPKPLPALLSLAQCGAILAQAAHILGYLHLDGEGTKADVGSAIKWFRLAERHGCRDAGRVLGSLFNTGQYA